MSFNERLSRGPDASSQPSKVGYVLKRYPRFSETFVVNEILAHEAAGLAIEIFALRPTVDSHFQHAIANVRADVHYLPGNGLRAATFWEEISSYGRHNPRLWTVLQNSVGIEVLDVYQGVQLALQVERLGIEHLHAHFATSASAVARVASLLTGVPYSITAHAKDIFHEEVNETQLEIRIADAAATITVSSFNVMDLSRRFPGLAQRIHRIYNGLPLNEYPYRDPRTRMKKVVAVGRLVEKKGFCDLVTACAELRHRGLHVDCEIIGEGDCEAALRKQVCELGLEESVRLLGALPQRDVHRIIQDAALFVAPCLTASTGDRDGLPTVLLEAMALGTPCIATDVTGISEVVRHMETGWLVPERQPVLLADGIQAMLADSPLGVQLARTARQLMQEQFDACENTARLRRVFGDCQLHAAGVHIHQPLLAEVG